MNNRIIPSDVIFDKCLSDIFAAGRKAAVKKSVIETVSTCPSEEQFAKLAKNVKN